jgi:hypothetical protein
MKQDQGHINLVVCQAMGNQEAIQQILNIAEARLCRGGDPTLKLVGYHPGALHAQVAMIQENEPGERLACIIELKRIPGVLAAG